MSDSMRNSNALKGVLRWWSVSSRAACLDRLMAAGVDHAVRQVGASAGLLWSYDGRCLHLITAARVSAEMFGPGELAVGEGLTGKSIEEGQALVSTDITSDKRMAYKDSGYPKVYRTAVAIPLYLGGRPVGAVTAFDKGQRVFTNECISTLRFRSQQLMLSMHLCSFFPELLEDCLALMNSDSPTLGTRAHASGGAHVPKGISRATLDLICSTLEAMSGNVTSDELAGMTGLSVTTLRHYLSYMAESAIVVRSACYGRPGRPEYRYRVNPDAER